MDWPALLALAALLIALAGYGYRARPGSPVNRWFALQTLTLALWIVGIAGTHTTHYAEFWGRWTFASASLMPSAFFGFTCVFPDNSRSRPLKALPVVVAIGVTFSALSYMTPLVAHSFVIGPHGLRRQPGVLLPLFALYFIVSTILVLGLLVVKWGRATGQAKAQLRFYNVGLVTLCIGAITTNLVLPAVTGHSEYSTVGPYFVLPLVGLIGHAIIRHRLFDLRLMIHRSVAFLLLIGSSSLLIVLGLKQTGVDDIQLPVETVVTVLVAAATLSVPIAPRLARLMDNYLVLSRPDLGQALQEAARRLSRLLADPEIVEELRQILRSTLAVDVVVVLADRIDPEIVPIDVHEAAWAISAPAPALLLLARETDAVPQTATLRRSGFEVWVALGRGRHRAGILLLGPRNGGEAYLSDTLQFVEDIAELCSMAFEVSFLHRRQIELQRERHRLEHFARMGQAYAGLGHEIRTPLTTISNLVSLIPDRLDDPEFRDVLTRLIPGEVARIVNLTERLRLMAPGDGARFGLVNLQKILSDIAAMQTASGLRVTVISHSGKCDPVVRGDESQLVQLFLNLVNNAVQAMPLGGAIALTIDTVFADRERPVVVAQVIDEGPGIAKEIAENIFEPFFTTKPSGTGLGLSICREIASFHNATLTLSPRIDRRGTVATVEFIIAEELHHQAVSAVMSASSVVESDIHAKRS